ncbi:hypothetical protein EGH21_01400 [Halomicroarcula sp. F13]|uniref:Sensor histidine kinase n=1 Tax=Haloarcula rubra TaxID=2487747 RepID=A0AAW4PLP3_9EURY|nr:hypothetical protein [Halomicroarcula rubra]MBX0321676.1 hypothetical protein [Halomicroarcula rubra]
MLVEAALFVSGLAALVVGADRAVTAAIVPSLWYMLGVSIAVLALFYWRRGIDRRAAVVCLALYLPSFALV